MFKIYIWGPERVQWLSMHFVLSEDQSLVLANNHLKFQLQGDPMPLASTSTYTQPHTDMHVIKMNENTFLLKEVCVPY